MGLMTKDTIFINSAGINGLMQSVVVKDSSTQKALLFFTASTLHCVLVADRLALTMQTVTSACDGSNHNYSSMMADTPLADHKFTLPKGNEADNVVPRSCFSNIINVGSGCYLSRPIIFDG